MSQLNEFANNCLQEFGGILPDVILSFEDARREFIQTYAFYLQKLGVSDTDKTLTITAVSAAARDGALPFGDVLPAFAEFKPTTASFADYRDKVEIVPVEEIPSYEGSRAIAFYGTPIRFRAAWSFFDYGTLYLGYDPIVAVNELRGTSDITFPPNFYTLLTKKTALNLVPLIRLKLAFLAPEEQKEMMPAVLPMLSGMETSLLMQVTEWEREFRTWKNKDGNETNRLRRTNDELLARSYHNISGRNPLDFVG